MFAWQSPRARKLGLARGELSADTLLGLMAGEPYLVRRPLVRRGDEVIPGANEKKLIDAFEGG